MAVRALPSQIQSQVCKTEDGIYNCNEVQKQLLNALDLPLDSGLNTNCKNCVIGLKTFIITNDYELVTPDSLIFSPTNETSHNSTFFRCQFLNGTNCECNQQQFCTGSESFCSFSPCIGNASCSCMLTHQKPKFTFVIDQEAIENPRQITFPICLINKKSERKPVKSHRRLLEQEEAVFTHDNLTVTFKDPILYLPGSGRVILRTEDYEHLLTVPDDNTIVLPFEMLAFKTTLLIIYINPKGYTVTGTVHVTGKSVCQKKTLLLLLEFGIYCSLCFYVYTLCYLFIYNN